MHLTDRQLQVLRYISMYQTIKTCPPTLKQIGKVFGFTINGAWDHVDTLIKKGVLRRERYVSRAVHITPQGQETLDLAPNTMAIEAGTMQAYEVVKVVIQ